jgi:hypothetical protein
MVRILGNGMALGKGTFAAARQLGDIRRDPAHLIFAEQLSRRSPHRWPTTLSGISVARRTQ